MVNTTMDLMEWLRKQLEEADTDLLREMMKLVAGMLMDAEVAAICGADYRERSDDRTNSRNGHRQRPWDTRVGSIDLAIPKLREGSYFPAWLLEPRRRAEQALMNVNGLGVRSRISNKQLYYGNKLDYRDLTPSHIGEVY